MIPEITEEPVQTETTALYTALTASADSQTAAAQNSTAAAKTVTAAQTAQTAPEDSESSDSEPDALTETIPAEIQTQSTAPVPESHAQTTQKQASVTTAVPALPPQTTEPQASSGNPGTPGAVFQSVTVSYDEAKDIFGHPILPCSRQDFLQYKAGIVSRNGNLHGDGTFCLSVTYEFADGQVTLTDWDRMHGSDGDLNDEQISYNGKTFYVHEYEDSIQIAYYSNGFDPFELSGTEYQAIFRTDADRSDIMELILSLVF